jgi:hypothetical protein
MRVFMHSFDTAIAFQSNYDYKEKNALVQDAL